MHLTIAHRYLRKLLLTLGYSGEWPERSKHHVFAIDQFSAQVLPGGGIARSIRTAKVFIPNKEMLTARKVTIQVQSVVKEKIGMRTRTGIYIFQWSADDQAIQHIETRAREVPSETQRIVVRQLLTALNAEIKVHDGSVTDVMPVYFLETTAVFEAREKTDRNEMPKIQHIFLKQLRKANHAWIVWKNVRLFCAIHVFPEAVVHGGTLLGLTPITETQISGELRFIFSADHIMDTLVHVNNSTWQLFGTDTAMENTTIRAQLEIVVTKPVEKNPNLVEEDDNGNSENGPAFGSSAD